MSTPSVTHSEFPEKTPLNIAAASSQTSLPMTAASQPETTQIASPLLSVIAPARASSSHLASNDAVSSRPDDAPKSSDVTTTTLDPQITLTFLLVSGRRRTLAFPEGTPVSRVKEILWNTWPSEWQDEQPPTPGFLRLLHLGKIWTDDVRLLDMNLSGTQQHPTVVHLSIRPFLPLDNDGLNGSGKKRKAKRASTMASDAPGAHVTASHEEREAGTGNSGCCCIIC